MIPQNFLMLYLFCDFYKKAYLTERKIKSETNGHKNGYANGDSKTNGKYLNGSSKTNGNYANGHSKLNGNGYKNGIGKIENGGQENGTYTNGVHKNGSAKNGGYTNGVHTNGSTTHNNGSKPIENGIKNNKIE